MVKGRPFDQRLIPKKDAVLEPFAGPAYKFYLLLPRYRKGREVFSAVDAQRLFRLLIMDFGGCSTTDEKKAPIIGGWQMREAEQTKPAIDLHRRCTVYTKPTNDSKTYFRCLEANLRKHLLATKGQEEEQIMIELSEVEIIKGKA